MLISVIRLAFLPTSLSMPSRVELSPQVSMLKFVRLDLGSNSRRHGLRPILLPTFFYAVSPACSGGGRLPRHLVVQFRRR